MRRWAIWGAGAAALAVALALAYLQFRGADWPEPLRELGRLATNREALRRLLEEQKGFAPSFSSCSRLPRWSRLPSLAS